MEERYHKESIEKGKKMVFQEPKVEFVEIDLINITTASPQCDQTTSKRGSVETCVGMDAPQNIECDASVEV